MTKRRPAGGGSVSPNYGEGVGMIVWIGIGALLFGGLGYIIGSDREIDAGAAWFWGFLLGPIGLVIVALSPSKPKRVAGLRPCPKCAEPIQAAASKCRFCQSEIEPVEGFTPT